MNYIDLHTHSSISDGTLTPRELVHHAISHNLSAIALTDHDTIDGIPEALSAASFLSTKEKPFQLIPGIELSASYEGQDIHILGLFLDTQNPILRERLVKIKSERQQRNQKMCSNLAEAGINITLNDLLQDEPNTVITRAHFARYLLDHGYVSSMKEAFSRYLDPSCPYYVPRNILSPQEAINLIQTAGGLAILAHPLLYHLSNEQLQQLINELKTYGLIGIEALYSSHNAFEESAVRRLARINNLYLSGGSDFHGSNKPQIEIGIGRGNLKIPESILQNLQEYHNSLINATM